MSRNQKEMKNVLLKILEVLGKDLSKMLMKVLDTVKEVFSFLEHRQEYKEEKQQKKDDAKEEKEIEKICDKGSLDDLLEKFTGVTAIALVLFLYGCATTQLEVTTTRQWEGHYFTAREFHEATSQIDLQKGESIWVLSNKTLNKILTSQRNNKK